MYIAISRRLGQRYAIVVAGVTFFSLLCAAGLRSVPGVLLIPWQEAFGWSRDIISLAAAVGILLFGLMGPFAGALMQQIGIKRTMIGGLTLMALSTGSSVFMTAPWQLIATWGVLSGIGSGCVSAVLSATIVNRWFVTNRGVAIGFLSASTATGTLIFLPALAAIADNDGWRPVVLVVSAVAALLVPLVWLLLPESPQAIGVLPFGAPADAPPAPVAVRANPVRTAFDALGRAASKMDFWLLFATFFICGFTTNGLIGTHLISLCADHGFPEVRAASLLALMGIFDIVGTTGSGWLTDRFDARKLLCAYYGLRGLSLIYLPFSDFSIFGLSIFAVFYGLDWLATVPPTLKLANRAFGERQAPIIFGWIFTGHQLGAACAAFIAGSLRTAEGNYVQAFVLAGATGLIAAGLALLIGRSGSAPAPVAA
jgi:MFS family permease